MTTNAYTDRFARRQQTRHYDEDARPTAGASRRARAAVRQMKRRNRRALRRALSTSTHIDA